jgi:5-deoxy-glucuronate isomerase
MVKASEDRTQDGSLIELFDVPPGSGHHTMFGPGEHGIEWLGLDIVRLEGGDTWAHRFEDREALLVVLSGSCEVHAGNRRFERVGGRADVFAGLPHAVYAPPQSDVVVMALGALEVAMVSAPAAEGTETTHITPDQVTHISTGRANWRRDVRLVVPPGSEIGSRLIVGETVNPPGNWSGIAPHKHDEITDGENAMEEFYLFKAFPKDGFGVQLSYRDGRGGAHLIGHDRIAFIHRGYHPTVAAPGMTLFYLWAAAGDRKDSRLFLDPRFGWLGNAEAILAELGRD